MSLAEEIHRLKIETDTIILAHYYQLPEVQDVADFVGDSLALAEKARVTDKKRILLAGVYFMAETAKILAPEKVVLFPDLNAGCSLADSCEYEDLVNFKIKNPEYKIVSYVNSSAKVKSLSYICCTSSNALKIVETIKNEKIMFVPDENLGNFIKSLVDTQEMLVWPGSCHVHKKFSINKLFSLKEKFPNALVIAHPECDKIIQLHADFVGSTSNLIKYIKENTSSIFLVATEPGVIHQMNKIEPKKQFIPIPPDDSECECNECEFMKMINLEKIYLTLKTAKPEIEIDENIKKDAFLPINRMLVV